MSVRHVRGVVSRRSGEISSFNRGSDWFTTIAVCRARVIGLDVSEVKVTGIPANRAAPSLTREASWAPAVFRTRLGWVLKI
jgi:hypothetical protein